MLKRKKSGNLLKALCISKQHKFSKNKSFVLNFGWTQHPDSNYYASLFFINLFYFHSVKCWFIWILHEEKNNETSYYGPKKSVVKNKGNISVIKYKYRVDKVSSVLSERTHTHTLTHTHTHTHTHIYMVGWVLYQSFYVI